ncbi:[histone H3]-lysine(4) N-trimethyltransferase [Trifolium repens]|nr:[histone H3]-lysine(4) N-trimethyltransferase [Trifolium repens]
MVIPPKEILQPILTPITEVPVPQPPPIVQAEPVTQQNRFNVLTDQDDQVDNLLITDGLVDSEVLSDEEESTQESEFVGDTPPAVLKNTEDLSLQIVRQVPSHDRIHKDMQFLKDSWANMADNEDQEKVLQDDYEADHENPSFTAVISKASKRAATTKSSTSKSIFGTRSKNSIDPDPLYIDDQLVAFKISALDKVFCVAAVYASTCYVKRRLLWAKLSELTSLHVLPWCYMGDFNVVLGMHEYSGTHSPDRLPMVEFQDWTSANDLLHLPTRGAWFTWTNGRKGNAHTKKRLDRITCNQAWLSFCNHITVSTLIR